MGGVPFQLAPVAGCGQSAPLPSPRSGPSPPSVVGMVRIIFQTSTEAFVDSNCGMI
jgi:hypothetical protein